MFLPEFLLKLSPRDEQVTWLDPLFRDVSGSVAAVSVPVTLDIIPADRALVLQTAAVNGNPGGAQGVIALLISLRPPEGSLDVILSALHQDSANAQRFHNWSGSILVPPRWLIRGEAIFTAGAVANVTSLDVTGILIPAGNVQRV